MKNESRLASVNTHFRTLMVLERWKRYAECETLLFTLRFSCLSHQSVTQLWGRLILRVCGTTVPRHDPGPRAHVHCVFLHTDMWRCCRRRAIASRAPHHTPMPWVCEIEFNLRVQTAYRAVILLLCTVAHRECKCDRRRVLSAIGRLSIISIDSFCWGYFERETKSALCLLNLLCIILRKWWIDK
jgi:hypothetical protein